MSSAALVCPNDACKQLVASRDGKHYGVHFANVADTKPCEMSCKPIVEEKPMEQKPTVEVKIAVSSGKPVDDVNAIWMALITERERLKQIIITRRGPRGELNDDEVADTVNIMLRVDELAKLTHERRDQVFATFAGKPKTNDQRVEELVEKMKR